MQTIAEFSRFSPRLSILDFLRDDVTILTNVRDALTTTLRAKAIFLGTYRFEPKRELTFTSRGIRMVVPNMKRPGELVVLNIHANEIVRTVYCSAPEVCAMFLYVVSSCSKYVRDEIEMGAECKGKSSQFAQFPHTSAKHLTG